MPEDVRVHVTDRAIISALNTPGGDIFTWRDKVGIAIANRAYDRSPVNNKLNAQHRGGVTGTYKKGWNFARTGSGGHRVRAVVSNNAPHAQYVEYGRRGSNEYQRFSWTEWGGEILSVGGQDREMGNGTRARPGKHILRNATNQVMSRETGGAYAPLP